MDPINLALEVSEAIRLLKDHRKVIPRVDFDSANIHLEAIRFHLARGDQTRALVEYKNSMNFVNTLIQALSNSRIHCFKQKQFTKLWAIGNKQHFLQHFQHHTVKFDAGMVKRDWVAKLYLIRTRRCRYTLEVLAENDDDGFVITATETGDKRILFTEVEIDPTLDWMFRKINQGFAAICLNYSTTLGSKQRKPL